MRVPALALAVLACGCGDEGTSHLRGTVLGAAITASHAVYVPADGQFPDEGALVIISSSSTPCGDFRDWRFDRDSEQLYFTVSNHVGAGFEVDDVMPGAYVPGGSGFTLDSASVVFHAECTGGSATGMTDGTVELDSVAADNLTSTRGTLRLVFGADVVTGTFDAPLCTASRVSGGERCR